MSTTRPLVDHAAERAVLGAVLLRPEVFHDLDLAVPEFGDPAARWVWEAMVECDAAGDPLDVLAVEARLPAGARLPEGYLLQLADDVPTAENVAYYATRVRQARIDREVRHAAHQILTAPERGDELLRLAAEKISGVTVPRNSAGCAIGEAAAEVLADSEAARRGELPGIVIGVRDWDEYAAAEAGDCIVLAGRPSMGKSAIMVWWASCLIKLQQRLLVVDLEKGNKRFARRVLSSEGRVNSKLIRDGRMDMYQRGDLQRAQEALRQWPMYLWDGSRRLEDVLRTIRRYVARHQITAVIVDYAQLIVGPGKDENAQLTAVCNRLYETCKELGLLLILLSQLNRSVELRQDKRPKLSDLRGTGTLEQIADVIAFAYRPRYYDAKADAEELQILFAKVRDGRVGMERLRWDIKNGRCLGLLRSVGGGPAQREVTFG